MHTSTNVLSCSSSRMSQPIRGTTLSPVIALSFMSDLSCFDHVFGPSRRRCSNGHEKPVAGSIRPDC
jgi:hypothetical protein